MEIVPFEWMWQSKNRNVIVEIVDEEEEQVEVDLKVDLNDEIDATLMIEETDVIEETENEMEAVILMDDVIMDLVETVNVIRTTDDDQAQPVVSIALLVVKISTMIDDVIPPPLEMSQLHLPPHPIRHHHLLLMSLVPFVVNFNSLLAQLPPLLLPPLPQLQAFLAELVRVNKCCVNENDWAPPRRIPNLPLHPPPLLPLHQHHLHPPPHLHPHHHHLH